MRYKRILLVGSGVSPQVCSGEVEERKGKGTCNNSEHARPEAPSRFLKQGHRQSSRPGAAVTKAVAELVHANDSATIYLLRLEACSYRQGYDAGKIMYLPLEDVSVKAATV